MKRTLFILAGLGALAAPLSAQAARAAAPRQPVEWLEANGVYQRESEGVGMRLYRDEIESGGSANLAQAVARKPGTVRVVVGGEEFVVFDRSSTVGRVDRTRATRCGPATFVDGERLPARGDGLNHLLPLDSVEAVELFPDDTTVPERFAGGLPSCGVIAIWTRNPS